MSSGYSGGRNGTATVQLVWCRQQQLKKNHGRIKDDWYVSSIDTGWNHLLSKWVENSLHVWVKVQKKKGMVATRGVAPAMDNTFGLIFRKGISMYGSFENVAS